MMAKVLEKYPFESDDEGDDDLEEHQSSGLDEKIVSPTKKETNKATMRLVLFVPYDYKEDCKLLGGKYDKECREWYVDIDPDKDYSECDEMTVELIDTFHRGNFFLGKRMSKYPITLKEFMKRNCQKFDRLKTKFDKYYKDMDFEDWCKKHGYQF